MSARATVRKLKSDGAWVGDRPFLKQAWDTQREAFTEVADNYAFAVVGLAYNELATLERAYDYLVRLEMLEHEGASPQALKAVEASGPKAPSSLSETLLRRARNGVGATRSIQRTGQTASRLRRTRQTVWFEPLAGHRPLCGRARSGAPRPPSRSVRLRPRVTGYGSPALPASTASAAPVNRCFTRGAGAVRHVTAGHHRPREAGTAARRRLAAPVGLPPGRTRPLPTPQRGQFPVIYRWGRRPGGHRHAVLSRPGHRLPALPRARSSGLDKGRRPLSCPAIGRPLACPH